MTNNAQFEAEFPVPNPKEYSAHLFARPLLGTGDEEILRQARYSAEIRMHDDTTTAASKLTQAALERGLNLSWPDALALGQSHPSQMERPHEYSQSIIDNIAQIKRNLDNEAKGTTTDKGEEL